MTWIQHKNFNPKKHNKYKPLNEHKYIGKHFPVTRSTYEWRFAVYCDKNEHIIAWASESIGIPYMFKGKQHRYFPDFFLKVRDKQGNITKWVVEIKPSKEATKHPPQKKGRKAYKTLLNEKETWEKNQAKWRAAQQYCNKRGYHFIILTEKDLFR